MTDAPLTHGDVLAHWTPATLSRRLGEEYATVQSWFFRNRYPARAIAPIVEIAREDGHADLTFEALVRAEPGPARAAASPPA